jgi:putative thioredoxin
MGLTAQEQRAVEEFQREVVGPSMDRLVILDFWAEWCGPCKALTPVLEKVAADYADKGVVLAKINVDENGFIASQFRVQSIPTVYAIFQGKPVADLTNARSESQLKGLLDQLLAKLPVVAGEAIPDLEPLLAMGEEVLSEGDAQRAVGIFSQIVDMAPDNLPALGGLIRALAAAGQIVEAQAAYDALPEAARTNAAVTRAHSALQLAADRPDSGAIYTLEAAVAADPDNHQARIDLAAALIGDGDYDGAATHLLHSIALDRDFADGAAKAKLLALFEMVGLVDPWVAATRRKLSAVLFG